MNVNLRQEQGNSDCCALAQAGGILHTRIEFARKGEDRPCVQTL